MMMSWNKEIFCLVLKGYEFGGARIQKCCVKKCNVEQNNDTGIFINIEMDEE